jgi:hypothetical protein
MREGLEEFAVRGKLTQDEQIDIFGFPVLGTKTARYEPENDEWMVIFSEDFGKTTPPRWYTHDRLVELASKQQQVTL